VGMASTRDDSKVLLSLGRANHVAILDAKTHDVIQFVLTGKRCWSVDLSRDEKTAIVANGLSETSQSSTWVDAAGAIDPDRAGTPHGSYR